MATDLDQLIEGIKAQVANVVDAIRTDPRLDKLRVSLARSTFEVAKVGDDRFGLLEYYPHVKRGTPGRKKKGDTESQPTTGETVVPDAAASAETNTVQQEEHQNEDS